MLNYCTKCGKKLKDGTKFCVHCGTQNVSDKIYQNSKNISFKKSKRKFKIWIPIIGFVCCATIVAILAVVFAFKPSSDSIISNYNSKIEVGDYLRLGTYYDEPIIWRCIDIDKNGPLMLTDKIICLKAFDAMPKTNENSGSHARGRKDNDSNYWKDSNIRSWLNSNAAAGEVEWLCGNPPNDLSLTLPYEMNKGFVHNPYNNEAGFLTNFQQNEKNAIKEVTQKCIVGKLEVENGVYDFGNEFLEIAATDSIDLSTYDNAYSEQVTDKIFLPDVMQINKLIENSDKLGEDYLSARLTQKAIEHNQYTKLNLSADKNWYYWLRTPDNVEFDTWGQSVRIAMSDKEIDEDNASDCSIGIRPAFYFDLSVNIQGDGTIENPFYIN